MENRFLAKIQTEVNQRKHIHNNILYFCTCTIIIQLLISRILLIEIGVIFWIRSSCPCQAEQVLINLSIKMLNFSMLGSYMWVLLYFDINSLNCLLRKWEIILKNLYVNIGAQGVVLCSTCNTVTSLRRTFAASPWWLRELQE